MNTLSINPKRNPFLTSIFGRFKIGNQTISKTELCLPEVDCQVVKEEAMLRAKLLGGIAYQMKRKMLPFQDPQLIETLKGWNILQSSSEDKRVLEIAQAWVEGWELAAFNAKVSRLVYWNENELSVEENLQARQTWNEIIKDYDVDIKKILQD